MNSHTAIASSSKMSSIAAAFRMSNNASCIDTCSFVADFMQAPCRVRQTHDRPRETTGAHGCGQESVRKTRILAETASPSGRRNRRVGPRRAPVRVSARVLPQRSRVASPCRGSGHAGHADCRGARDANVGQSAGKGSTCLRHLACCMGSGRPRTVRVGTEVRSEIDQWERTKRCLRTQCRLPRSGRHPSGRSRCRPPRRSQDSCLLRPLSVRS